MASTDAATRTLQSPAGAGHSLREVAKAGIHRQTLSRQARAGVLERVELPGSRSRNERQRGSHAPKFRTRMSPLPALDPLVDLPFDRYYSLQKLLSLYPL